MERQNLGNGIVRYWDPSVEFVHIHGIHVGSICGCSVMEILDNGNVGRIHHFNEDWAPIQESIEMIVEWVEPRFRSAGI